MSCKAYSSYFLSFFSQQRDSVWDFAPGDALSTASCSNVTKKKTHIFFIFKESYLSDSLKQCHTRKFEANSGCVHRQTVLFTNALLFFCRCFASMQLESSLSASPLLFSSLETDSKTISEEQMLQGKCLLDRPF